MPQRRNPVAVAPILRKGGPHQKTRSAERGQAKRGLKKAVEQWRGREAPSSQAQTQS